MSTAMVAFQSPQTRGNRRNDRGEESRQSTSATMFQLQTRGNRHNKLSRQFKKAHTITSFNPLKRGAIAATGTLFRHVFSMCYNPILHDLPILLMKLTYTEGACFPLATNSFIKSTP